MKDGAVTQKGEPMSNDECIKWLTEIKNKYVYSDPYHYAIEIAINALSAHPEQRWIPCSERLPHGSCSDLVNVSIHDDSGDTPFDYTSCGWVTTDGEYWIVDNEINNHVIAWMPLPEPYRAERRTDG